MEHETPSNAAKAPLPARAHIIAVAIGLAAVIWFMLLSGWMNSVPGSVVAKRQNVLFNSDSSIWLGQDGGELQNRRKR